MHTFYEDEGLASKPLRDLCISKEPYGGKVSPLSVFSNGKHPKDWDIKSFALIDTGWKSDMTATPYDVGVICEDLNWSLLGLKSYSLDFCLKKVAEGFVFNIAEGLPLGTSVGRLLNSPVLAGRDGLARGAYSSGSGTSGSPFYIGGHEASPPWNPSWVSGGGQSRLPEPLRPSFCSQAAGSLRFRKLLEKFLFC